MSFPKFGQTDYLSKYIRNTARRLEKKKSRGLLRNPIFYFGFIAVILFWFACASSDSLANVSGLNNSRVVFFNSFFNKNESFDNNSLFSSQPGALTLESPDFKLIQNNTLAAVSVPSIVAGKVLGNVLGSSSQNKKEIIDYTVQPGDTLQSIASSFDISVDTLLLTNELTSSSVIKVGQSLAILPTDGILHIVKSGDTVSGIAQTYKVQQDEIISFNDLANQNDIYIGDILVVPGGIMPKKSVPAPSQIPVASTYFIFPTEGEISQGLHYYNAIDIANKCGTPVHAAAAGIVQRVSYGWNFGGGNLVTILHGNGTVTYYGHLMTIFVKSGQEVKIGERIGLMGNTGNVRGPTGCHLHFGVTGAKNPLSGYSLKAKIKY